MKVSGFTTNHNVSLNIYVDILHIYNVYKVVIANYLANFYTTMTKNLYSLLYCFWQILIMTRLHSCLLSKESRQASACIWLHFTYRHTASLAGKSVVSPYNF